jgi:hypothetical protein
MACRLHPSLWAVTSSRATTHGSLVQALSNCLTRSCAPCCFCCRYCCCHCRRRRRRCCCCCLQTARFLLKGLIAVKTGKARQQPLSGSLAYLNNLGQELSSSCSAQGVDCWADPGDCCLECICIFLTLTSLLCFLQQQLGLILDYVASPKPYPACGRM